jgi:6-pyruvoyl-tetrahydropterin synthase
MASTIKKLIVVIFSLSPIVSYTQGFNDAKTSLSNFIKRMYNITPFEGVKVIDDYDHQYFISLVNLEKAKYPSASTMTRVAQVKAQQQANTFFNGSFIASDFIIKTTEAKSKESTSTIIETMESIKENSLGFVKGMELLTNFEVEEAKRMVFIYYKEIEKTK